MKPDNRNRVSKPHKLTRRADRRNKATRRAFFTANR